MHPGTRFPRRQKGAVAVMTGLLLLLVLIPLGGLVVDLGHLYIAKAELQNAADASALAAAKDLNNTTAGVNAAIASGTLIGGRHEYDFSVGLSLAETDFSFSSSPDGPWISAAAAKVTPANLSFVKVDTGSKTLNTYLIQVAGIETTSTKGVAVAGRYVTLVTPIGICAADPDHRTAKYTYASGVTELVEFGFRRGVAYNTFSLGSLGGATYDPYLINPVSPGSGTCDSSASSAAATAPFVCNGNSAVLTTGSTGQVYTNTGMSSSIEKALNSRFGDYTGSPCVAAQAPPDKNVKEFFCRGTGTGCVNSGTPTPSSTPPIHWMEAGAGTYPNRMTVTTRTSGSAIIPNYPFPDASSGGPSGGSYANFADYGPLWTYTRPVTATSATPPAADTPITLAQANASRSAADPGKMYGTVASGLDYFDTANYPTSVGSGMSSDYQPAPYNQTGDSNYWQNPSGSTPGVADRRVLNLIMVDCRVAPINSPGASCGKMTAVGIGRFFMLRRASFGGAGGNRLDVEFVGLVEPVPDAAVKLYR